MIVWINTIEHYAYGTRKIYICRYDSLEIIIFWTTEENTQIYGYISRCGRIEIMHLSLQLLQNAEKWLLK